MIKYEDECVGCPEDMGCLGSACPNLNVERHYCDTCGKEARYNIEGQDFCRTCADIFLTDLFRTLSLEDKADLLDIDVEDLYD